VQPNFKGKLKYMPTNIIP